MPDKTPKNDINIVINFSIRSIRFDFSKFILIVPIAKLNVLKNVVDNDFEHQLFPVIR